jgi:antiviral helicase SLH1
MADQLDAMEAEWLRKLTTMREAISKLNLPECDLPELPLASFRDDELLFDSGSGNITDYLSDESSDEENPQLAVVPTSDSWSTISYNRQWLESHVKRLTFQNPGHSPDDLTNQIVAVLASDSTGQIGCPKPKVIAKVS